MPPMGHVIAGQTISLDGFVADSDGSAEPLYPDLAALQGSPYMNAMIEETGAVVMGRRSFEMPEDPDSLADSYEFQVPILVVTHRPPQVPPKENGRLRFTFVTDGVEAAVRQAVEAAGPKSVTVVGGVDIIRQAMQADLVDELRVDVMPVLLGAGTRFLDDPSLAGLQLEKVAVEEVGDRTSLRFRVLRA